MVAIRFAPSDTEWNRVIRLLPDGTSDHSFDGYGLPAVPNSVIWQEDHQDPFAVAPQANGKVVAVGRGWHETAPGEGKFIVAAYRFAADGSADVSFGPEGGTTTEFVTDAAGNAVAVQPDGKILVAGTAPGAGGGDFLLSRYQGDGGPGGGDDWDDQVNEAFGTRSPWKPQAGRSILTGSDVDLYRVDAPAGRRIGFDVDRPAGSTLDSFLRVFDASGAEIGSNDNAAAPGESAAGGDSYVEVTFPASGAYYVGVSSKGNTTYSVTTGAGDAVGATTGAYTLTLTERTPRRVGEYDYRFGYDGVAPAAGDSEVGLAVLPDGRFVAAGIFNETGFDPREEHGNQDIMVYGYTADGLPDPTYASGRAGDDWTQVSEYVAGRPDGRVVVAGTNYHWGDGYDYPSTEVYITEFGPGGGPGGGRVLGVGEEGGPDHPTALAIAPDGKVLVGGTATEPPGRPAPPGAQRLFVGVGDRVAIFDFSAAGGRINALATLPDGCVLAAGAAGSASGTDFAVAKVKPDGTLDASFGGGDGKVTTDFGAPGGDDTANAIVPLPGGKFMLLGGAVVTDRSELAFARYNADGTLDTTFGTGGKKTVRLAGPAWIGAALLDGGKILVGSRGGFGLARYSADGVLDTTFGTNGFAASPVWGINQILTLPGGDWLVAGPGARARHLSQPLLPPPSPGGTQVYQAESAALAGAVVSSNHARYTGTGFVDYLHRTGDSVEFVIDVPTTGTYFLDFRYANGGTYDRPLDLKVNGQVDQSKLPFAPTGSWGIWSTSTASVTLPAGRSIVQLTAAVASGPNLDAMTLRPPDTQRLEAEAAVLSGATLERSHSGYTGSGYADYAHASGDSVEWKVNLPSAGKYELSFRYANGGTSDRPLDLSVNGQPSGPPLRFAPTGGWSAWKTTATTLTLSAGINTLLLTARGFSGPNIDALTVRPKVPG